MVEQSAPARYFVSLVLLLHLLSVKHRHGKHISKQLLEHPQKSLQAELTRVSSIPPPPREKIPWKTQMPTNPHI